jgi:hypothetical protein
MKSRSDGIPSRLRGATLGPLLVLVASVGFTRTGFAHHETLFGPQSSLVLAAPASVWGPGGDVLLFAMTSFPVVQSYRNDQQPDRWRVGAGMTYLLGERD